MSNLLSGFAIVIVAGKGNKMVLVWNDPIAFRCHLDNMKKFRKSHLDIVITEDLNLLKNMPVPFDNVPPCWPGIIKSFTDTRGKTILVPIWKTTLPRGSQN